MQEVYNSITVRFFSTPGPRTNFFEISYFVISKTTILYWLKYEFSSLIIKAYYYIKIKS